MNESGTNIYIGFALAFGMMMRVFPPMLVPMIVRGTLFQFLVIVLTVIMVTMAVVPVVVVMVVMIVMIMMIVIVIMIAVVV